jgi:hypothetical protein
MEHTGSGQPFCCQTNHGSAIMQVFGNFSERYYTSYKINVDLSNSNICDKKY